MQNFRDAVWRLIPSTMQEITRLSYGQVYVDHRRDSPLGDSFGRVVGDSSPTVRQITGASEEKSKGRVGGDPLGTPRTRVDRRRWIDTDYPQAFTPAGPQIASSGVSH